MNYISRETDQLYREIRFAKKPDNPDLIKEFLMSSLSKDEDSIQARRRKYLHQFYLLIETMSDDLVPAHWRRSCLDNIYRPLQGYRRLALCPTSQRILEQMYYELNETIRYFGPSMAAN